MAVSATAGSKQRSPAAMRLRMSGRDSTMLVQNFRWSLDRLGSHRRAPELDDQPLGADSDHRRSAEGMPILLSDIGGAYEAKPLRIFDPEIGQSLLAN